MHTLPTKFVKSAAIAALLLLGACASQEQQLVLYDNVLDVQGDFSSSPYGFIK